MELQFAIGVVAFVECYIVTPFYLLFRSHKELPFDGKPSEFQDD